MNEEIMADSFRDIRRLRSQLLAGVLIASVIPNFEN
jgi:hypothetical protein